MLIFIMNTKLNIDFLRDYSMYFSFETPTKVFLTSKKNMYEK